MLQPHLSSVWIGSKVAEKVKELTQQSQKNNFCIRLTFDKRFRWWAMIGTPFLIFYLAGIIFSADTLFIIKFFLLGCLYAIAHTIGRLLFDDYLMTLLPLSVYMATKLWFYVTWLTYIAPTVSILTSVLFVKSSIFLWYCFLKSWRGDPGVIKPTQDQRFRVSKN